MELNFDQYIVKDLPFDQPEKYFDLIQKNSSRLEDFFPGTVAANETQDKSREFVKEMKSRLEAKSYFPYVILEKASDHFIGIIDVKNIDWKIPKAEIGYFIDKDFQGRGIISKALELVIWEIEIRHKFAKLLLRIGTQNHASKKVALKNEFQLEGIIRRDFKTRSGQVVDLEYYGRLRKDK